jgi:hypothetical protein
MLRFIRFTSALLLLLTSAIGSAVFFGTTQLSPPTPEKIQSFHLNECMLPCWLGIEPGKTTLASALERISAVYGNQPNYTISDALKYSIRVRDDETGLTIDIFPDDFNQTAIVETIVLYFSTYQISVDDLHSLCFSPTHIAAWPLRNSGAIAIVCNNYRVGIQIGGIRNNTVTANTQAMGIILTGTQDSVRVWIKKYHALKWHGYGTYPTLLQLWLNFATTS